MNRFFVSGVVAALLFIPLAARADFLSISLGLDGASPTISLTGDTPVIVETSLQTILYLYDFSDIEPVVHGTDLNAVLSNYNQGMLPLGGCGTLSLTGGSAQQGTDLNTVLSNYNQSMTTSTVSGGRLVFDYTGTTWGISSILDTSFGTATVDSSHGIGWVDNATTQQVTVMHTLYGGSNLDGSVKGTDLNAVFSYYNQSSQVWGHNDFNYDGSVNGTDLNTVLSNYNQSLPASVVAVPEPSILLLLVLGLAGLLGYVWRK